MNLGVLSAAGAMVEAVLRHGVYSLVSPPLEQFQRGQGKQMVFLSDQTHNEKQCWAVIQPLVLAKRLI